MKLIPAIPIYKTPETIRPEIKIPKKMALAVFFKDSPKICAAMTPLQAPVKGSGTATKIVRAAKSHFQLSKCERWFCWNRE